MINPSKRPTEKIIIPNNLLEQCNVQFREISDGVKQYCTGGDKGILKKLYRIKPLDAYCLIGLTNEDLYQSDKHEFCFGQTMQEFSISAFSLHRFDPKFENEIITKTEQLMRYCHMIARAITHIFGLRNCVYYECLMNGIANVKE